MRHEPAAMAEPQNPLVCRRDDLMSLKAVGASRTTLGARDALLIIFLIGATVSLPVSVHAQALECPTIDRSAVAKLNAADSQIQRMTTMNDADLGNEIGGLIDRLKAENPTVSKDAITDILIAAYCPVVAHMPNVSPAQKWQLMRRFDRVLMEQIAAHAMPSNSSIIASVPLPPKVYRNLSKQAEASGQTTADFMASVLTSAARQ